MADKSNPAEIFKRFILVLLRAEIGDPDASTARRIN